MDILVIDDDQGTLETFGAILRDAGHQVSTASSGSMALECFTQQVVDLAITDVNLPDISGIDVMRTLRKNGDSTRFVFVTGFGRPRDVVTAMRLGALDFVEKPLFEDD